MINLLGAISLGQLYTKHRVAGAVIAYLGIRAVKRIFSQFLALISYSALLNSAKFLDTSQMLLFIGTLINAAIAAGLLFASYHMMTRRLNLE